MAVMRTYMRALQINKEPNEAVLKELGLTKQDVEDMYRLLAIAKYKDRFVIPTSHREQVADLYSEQGSCGLSFTGGGLLYDNFLNKGAENYETKFTNSFSCSSFLLSYPELGWREAVTELQEEVETIEQEDVKASLTAFIKQALDKTNDHSLIVTYIHSILVRKQICILLI